MLVFVSSFTFSVSSNLSRNYVTRNRYITIFRIFWSRGASMTRWQGKVEDIAVAQLCCVDTYCELYCMYFPSFISIQKHEYWLLKKVLIIQLNIEYLNIPAPALVDRAVATDKKTEKQLSNYKIEPSPLIRKLKTTALIL